MPKLEENPKDIFQKKLKIALRKSERPPFIFAGSGISINYCGIPTWINLLKDFVESNRGCFAYDFGYYSSQCSGKPLQIASNLAKEFHEYWWKSDEYKINRKEYGHIAQGDTEIAFKIELAHFVESKRKIKAELKDEIDLMSKSIISGILTTNWDDFLQQVFSEFNIVIGQKETIFSDQKSIGELYKIHGCVSKPESLVVTSKDYEIFMKDNHYLNAKLLTLFVEYPIIFMGYSLSDPNIEIILKNLISCLDEKLFHSDKLRDRLFFVEWQINPCSPSIETSTYTMNQTSIPLQKIKVHYFRDIWEVLGELPRTLPVKLIRQLQNMVYEFVTTTSATKKVLVHGLDELEAIEDLEVVVGFGNISKIQEKGIIGLKVIDLIKDILFDTISKESYNDIAEQLLHTLITKTTYCPFFKYNKEIGNLCEDNSLKNYTNNNFTLDRSKNITLEDYQLASQRLKMKAQLQKYNCIEELIEDLSVIHAIQRIPYLDYFKIDPKVLRQFLIENWDKYHTGNNYSSGYRKCVCLLDFIENANHKN